MVSRLFTFVSEFRGTTYVSQVSASDEHDAVRVWADTLRRERPFGRASSYLAKAAGSEGFSPVVIGDLANVWCVSAVCGGHLMLADIVETVRPMNRS